MHAPLFFRDRQGNVVLYQTPNPPLILTIVAAIGSFVTGGDLRQSCRLIAYGSLFCWAWLELRSGVTPFRRTLGGFLLALLVLAAFVPHFVLA